MVFSQQPITGVASPEGQLSVGGVIMTHLSKNQKKNTSIYEVCSERIY
jgi:hypothetical protein